MKTKDYRGITLIALIITIIVLLILAGVSISMVVGDNGILTQAVNAADSTDIAETKEAIELAVIGYYDENGEYTTADVAQAVIDAGATLGSDGVTVTTAKGNTFDISDLVNRANVSWYYDSDGNVTNGIVTLTIGDYVNYTPSTDGYYPSYTSANGYSNQNFYSTDYTGTWRVMGVENGQILLISTGTVGSLYLSGETGYMYGVDELNNICAIYGTGDYATGARSINLEDISNLTGYDPSDTDGEGTPFGDDTIYEYGMNVTYILNGSTVTAVGDNGVTLTLSFSHSSGFKYYDEESGTFKTLSSGNSVTLTNSAWYLTFESSSWSSGSLYDKIEDNEIVQDLLSCSSEYLLGSRAINSACSAYVIFGLFEYYANMEVILSGSEGSAYGALVYSNGNSGSYAHGVRAVVSLESSVSLTSAGSNTWNISD